MCTQLPSTAIKYGFRDPIKKSNLRLEIAETLDIRQFALSRHLVFFLPDHVFNQMSAWKMPRKKF
jgi:hypothetical protein